MEGAEKRVDSYRFLSGMAKRAMQRWAQLAGPGQIPWTPLAKPLSQCTVALVSSAGIALKSDPPFNREIEDNDPWFSDPSFRRIPNSAKADDIRICHLHINASYGEQDLNCVLPVDRLNELERLGEIARSAAFHYSYMGYTMRPEPLLRDSVPAIVDRLREEKVDVVVLVPV